MAEEYKDSLDAYEDLLDRLMYVSLTLKGILNRLEELKDPSGNLDSRMREELTYKIKEALNECGCSS